MNDEDRFLNLEHDINYLREQVEREVKDNDKEFKELRTEVERLAQNQTILINCVRVLFPLLKEFYINVGPRPGVQHPVAAFEVWFNKINDPKATGQ